MSELNLEGELRDNFREHKFHDKVDEGCSICYAENQTLTGMPVEDMFKFENVIKMVGNINRAIYGINPYEKI